MKKQKSVFQMKEQDKIPEQEPLWNGDNLPNKEFRVMVIKQGMSTART